MLFYSKIDSAVQKRRSGLGLGRTKIILTLHIRLRFKNFDELEFKFGLGSRLLNYKSYDSVWIQCRVGQYRGTVTQYIFSTVIGTVDTF